MYWAWVAPLVTESKFDPLNALFSGLAFWGVIYAILLQRNELALQRKELELTRSEVRGQKEQLQAQNVTMKQQRFENTVFSLLNLFNSIVDSMETTKSEYGEPKTFKGRDCFTLFYNDLYREYTGQKNTTPDWTSPQLCIAAYDRFAAYRHAVVGHYFRTLYNIIKFIEKSDVEDKQTYINIVSAQLSSSELILLFYYCLSRYDSQQFKLCVERFGLLKDMPLANLFNQGDKVLYEESAFISPP
jgi:hypothetical protein